MEPHSQRGISSNEFAIDLATDRVRCSMGHQTTHWAWAWVLPGRGKAKVHVKRFAFPKEPCRACPRYPECVTDKRRRGRFVTLRSNEERLQAARAFERSVQFHEH